MFKFLATSVLMVTLSQGISSSSLAEEQKISKFGIVDMQQVILTVEEGKAARATLEAEIKTKETELQKRKQELDKLADEWKSQAPLLSEEARFSKQKDMQEKYVAIRNEEMKFQNEMKQKEGEATQKIAMRVAGLVDGLAKTEGLDAVFEANSSGLLFVKNPVDLTAKVITAYNSAPKSAKK